MPYIGSSAGSNVACPSIKTTNGYAIVEARRSRPPWPRRSNINPHYLDPIAGSTPWATREERIAEFLRGERSAVVGLREGAWLDVVGENVALGGSSGARLFRRGLPRGVSQRLKVGLLVVDDSNAQ
jgi:dipeptidase E